MYGLTFDMNDLFTKLYSVALKGDPDCGGMISYNYFSGEPVTGFDAGHRCLYVMPRVSLHWRIP